MELSQLLKDLKGRAASRRKEHEKVVRNLRGMKPRDAEELLAREHEEAFSRISCLECAHCCRTLGPRLTDRDLQRLADAFRLKTTVFSATYLKRDEDGDLVFKEMPCPFLGDDNRCSVYDVRPKACADYPHTLGRQAKALVPLLIPNAAICPAVYRILESLSKKS